MNKKIILAVCGVFLVSLIYNLLAKATSCLHAVLTKNKIQYTSLKTEIHNKKLEVSATETNVSNESAEIDAISRIREIAITDDSSRIKDYIKFNSHLDRKLASVSDPNLKDCETN